MRYLILIAALALTACRQTSVSASVAPVLDAKTHHAVLLDNGSVFFGLIESNGPEFLVLKNVFYVQTRV